MTAAAVVFETSHPKSEQNLSNVAVTVFGGGVVAAALGDVVPVVGLLDLPVAFGVGVAGVPEAGVGAADAGVPLSGATGVEDTGAPGDEGSGVPAVDGVLLGSAYAKPIAASQNAVTAAKNATPRFARISAAPICSKVIVLPWH